MKFNPFTINEAVRLHKSGNLDEAENIYRRILDTQPENPDALHLLGVIAYQRKKYEEAEDLIRRAINLNKRTPEFRNNLGNVYLAQKKFDKAEECYRAAVKQNPRYVDARNNLGNALREKGRFQESIDSFQRALQVDPSRADIHNNLGMVLEGAGRSEEAAACYREAIRVKPDFCDAYTNLGVAYKSLGRFQEAIESCSHALRINPSYARALLNMGNAYSESGEIEKGAEYFLDALRYDPDLCEAHLNLGHALREAGETREAVIHYQRALDLKPKSLAVRLGNCIGRIPLLHASAEAIAVSRQDYRSALESLSRDIDLADPHTLSQAALLVGTCQPFYLAYQGENDCELQSLYGNLMVRIQSACYPAWSKKSTMPPIKEGEPLRIGIVSGFYFLHSNWKIPIKGWAENLNRRDLQLFGYHTGQNTDAQTEVARRTFHQFTENLTSLEKWCNRICEDRLHVLLFPEVGMDIMTVRLASLRLAPIQCASWGHPDTTGLPTIDYYLSSDLMEPADADDHYTEKLVRLPNLSIHYEPPPIEPAPVDRAYFGLSEKTVLFICTQSLFKYLPQFDEVFPRIASEVGQCQFAFLNYRKSPKLGERFMHRLELAFSRHGLRCADYVKLIPHLDPAHYRALNQVADVFLDSIGWSGCNSTLEALACDLPVVTMPGKLMRGRHTHAILEMMGLHETEARDIDEYVAIAKRLGTDADWRKQIGEKISLLISRAYYDDACIRGLEEFLKKAVASYPQIVTN
jgi:protein O-GlcNAc transferase